MRGLTLYPSVVWSIDDRSWPHLSTWYDSLDLNAKIFVKASRNVDDVRKALDQFLEERFEAELIRAGVTPSADALRINLITVSCCIGRDARSDLELADTLQNEYGRSTIFLERQDIFLAHLDAHLASGRSVETSGLKRAPWLLTTITSEGRRLREADLSDRTGRLLDVFILAERENPELPSHVIQSFFGCTEQHNYVRLPAFPRHNFEPMFDHVIKLLGESVLHQAAQSRSFEAPKMEKAEKHVRKVLQDFYCRRLLFSELSERLFDSGGFGGLSLGDLIFDAREKLQRILNELESRSRYTFASDVPEPCNFEGQLNWKQKLVSRLARSVGLEVKPIGERCEDSAASPSEHEFIIERLKNQVSILEKVASMVGEMPRVSARIPRDALNSWSQRLDADLKLALKQGNPDFALFAGIQSSVRKEVEERFEEVISDWEIRDDVFEDFVSKLNSGKVLRFTAPMIPGRKPRANSIITSLKLPDSISHDRIPVPCAGVRVWANRPTIFIGGSEPVAVEELRL